MMAVLKPKQEYQALTEEKNHHLTNRLKVQAEEIDNALALKGEFIRNVTHEYHAPMTGVISMSQVMLENYNSFTDEQRIAGLETIFKSAIRLESFDQNIALLAKLSKKDVKLDFEVINLGQLFENRIELCRKLYEDSRDDREFILKIEPDLRIKGDKEYIIQMLDNLIINAITYCPNGKIECSLERLGEMAIIKIEDEGIGIPQEELKEIFKEFTVSSRTASRAHGRGVGLALCKRIADLHEASIWAESEGKKGSRLYVKFITTK